MPDEIASRGSKQESGAAQGRANGLSWHDRVVGAALMLIVLAAQTHWMGLAIILLSGGLVLAYGVWVCAKSERSSAPSAAAPRRRARRGPAPLPVAPAGAGQCS